MSRFAAGLSQHPVPSEAVGEVVGQVLDQLPPGEASSPPGLATPRVASALSPGSLSLALLFVSPHHVGAVEDIAPAVRRLLQPRVLLGCTTIAVIGGAKEAEDEPGISLLVADLDGAELTPISLSVQRMDAGVAVVGWPAAATSGTLISLIDPFSFPGDAFLDGLHDAAPGVEAIGGLASAARGPGGNRLVLDDSVVSEGAVGVLVGSGVEVVKVVSQGCRPIGTPLTVTRSSGNLIQELGGRTALERLEEAVAGLSEAERELLGNGLHIGRVVDEHRTEFARGDFVIRNVMGIDRSTGAVAVGDVVELGHTVQFHVRDAVSADEDLRELLAGARADAALLFTCNGRGRHLFGEPDHDAGTIESLLGPLPLSGMFCAGELGPVGGRNFLHGFTASLALLRG